MGKPKRKSLQDTTVRQVAARAGVSSMTVSRVVNDAPNVADHTRKAVMAAIDELDYVPNPAARRLATAGAGAVRMGLLYRAETASYMNEFLLGAMEESRDQGHELLLQACGDTSAGERAALHRLIEDGICGVVLPPPLSEDETLLSEIVKTGVAAVTSGAGHADLPSVQMDDREAAREMTAYLLSLGHRRIGFIKGHPEHACSAQRLAGFEQALREAGLEHTADCVEDGYFDYRSGLRAAQKLLSENPRPTAIFAANDDMAAAVLAVAHSLDIDVPRDLSVAGFDDSLIAGAVWPKLTTVRQPIQDMGRSSIRLLAQEMQRRKRAADKRAIPRKVLRHMLIRRDSTDRQRLV